jgi:DNA polymerase-3 subunit gamma/tau
VRAACGDQADDAAVAEALGAVDAAAISRIGAALLRRDGAAVLAEVDALHARGLEMKRVAEELARHLRNVLVARLVPDSPLDLPDAEAAEVREQAAGADPAQVTRLFDLAQRAVNDVKLAEGSRHALEVALLEGVFLAPGAQVAELVARLDAIARGAGGGGGSGSRVGVGVGSGVGSRSGSGSTSGSGSVSGSASVAASGSVSAPASAALAVSASVPTPPSIPSFGTPGCAAPSAPAGTDAERWRAAVEAVEKVSPMAAPALKQAALLRLAEGEVSVQLAPGLYAQAAEKRRAEIEAELGRFFGRPTRLAVTVSTAPPPAPVEEAPPASIAEVEAAERQARSARVRDAARGNENIREAARILGGGIEKIEEL